MQLELELPSAWPRITAGGRACVIVPGHAKDPDLLLAWSPMIVLPDEQRAWVMSELRLDTPPNAQIQVTADANVTTKTGWPVRVVEAQIHGTPDGPITEWRTVVFYAFLEHASTAMVRGMNEARYRQHLDVLRGVLASGRPDWSGEVAALSEVWDVKVTTASRPTTKQPLAAVREQVANAALSDAVLRVRLSALDDEIARSPSATAHVQRGEVLRRLRDLPGALASYRAALALDAMSAPALVGVATVQAEQGLHGEATASWEAAASADPAEVDALFNAGIGHYRDGAYAKALAAWTRAAERIPEDFWLARKILQAHYALGHYDEAAIARLRLIDLWRTSGDPAVRMQHEFVFDQIELPGGLAIHAFETLSPNNPASYSIFTFRLVDPRHTAPTLEVAVETSDYAKQRGVPYVLSILNKDRYKALGTSEHLMPYPELKATVLKLVTDALEARSTS